MRRAVRTGGTSAWLSSRHPRVSRSPRPAARAPRRRATGRPTSTVRRTRRTTQARRRSRRRTSRSWLPRWRFRGVSPTKPGQPGRGFLSSPTVVRGDVYIGADTGWFYKLDAVTGHILAKRFVGFQRATTCPPSRGFVDTASVDRDDSGQLMVYVGGPDGYLYALRASNLSVKWRSVIAIPAAKVNDYFQWSSPTVARGRVYIGVASNCDHPLVPSGADQLQPGQRQAAVGIPHAGRRDDRGPGSGQAPRSTPMAMSTSRRETQARARASPGTRTRSSSSAGAPSSRSTRSRCRRPRRSQTATSARRRRSSGRISARATRTGSSTH